VNRNTEPWIQGNLFAQSLRILGEVVGRAQATRDQGNMEPGQHGTGGTAGEGAIVADLAEPCWGGSKGAGEHGDNETGRHGARKIGLLANGGMA